MKSNKILKELAPLLSAFLLVFLLFFLPISVSPKFSQKELSEFAADPGNRLNFIGYAEKEQAFANPKLLPILGSSELEHVNPYHPTAFFSHYPSNYTPYLVGMPGTSSLTHSFYLTSIASQMKNRKIVFIISPQWFTQRGLSETAFEQFVSKGEIYAWLAQANPKDSSSQYLARRLLAFKGSTDDALIKSCLVSLSKGKAIGEIDKVMVLAADQFWKREDSLFSPLSAERSKLVDGLGQAKKDAALLPNVQNDHLLSELAVDYAQKNQNNNPFQINNKVWNTNLGHRWTKLKDYQKSVSYLQSPEYADFQSLLNVFAKNHDDVQFIIQPVNAKWYNYTGLSISMLEDFSRKITVQLRSQGFNNIVDFTNQYKTPYFIGDTDHFGSLGWLKASLSIQQFMKEKAVYPTYKLDNQTYLSHSWDNQK